MQISLYKSSKFCVVKNKQNMEEVRKRPITAELRNLRAGETAHFPIELYGSVNAVVSRLKRELLREQWSVVLHEDRKRLQYNVTRIK